MNTTQAWIQSLESKAFPSIHTQNHRTDEFAMEFFRNTTLLNNIMSNGFENCVERLVLSASGAWNDYRIKSFLISDYPISQIEAAFKGE